MSHERLAALMQLHQDALATQQESLLTHDTFLSIFFALDKRHITERQALRLLGYQTLRLSEEPTHATIYRQAAAVIRQMQREEL